MAANGTYLVCHIMVGNLQHQITTGRALQFVTRMQVRTIPVRRPDQMIERQRLSEAAKLGPISGADEIV
jgi:hypothetical protein